MVLVNGRFTINKVFAKNGLPSASQLKRYAVMLMLVLLAACSNTTSKSDLSKLLDSRDAAISNQDLTLYASLLLDTYNDEQGTGILAQMQQIFARFEQVDMTSRDREIRIVNLDEAMCEQTYVLKVFADGGWREIIQREQLYFKRKNGQWKISAGL